MRGKRQQRAAMSGTPEEGGRVNQARTRAAIVAACQELIMAGAEVDIRRSLAQRSSPSRPRTVTPRISPHY